MGLSDVAHNNDIVYLVETKEHKAKHIHTSNLYGPTPEVILAGKSDMYLSMGYGKLHTSMQV